MFVLSEELSQSLESSIIVPLIEDLQSPHGVQFSSVHVLTQHMYHQVHVSVSMCYFLGGVLFFFPSFSEKMVMDK